MNNYIKALLMVVLILGANGCKKQLLKEKEPVRFYYLSYYKFGSLADTIPYEDVNIIEEQDELLATEFFEYRKQFHTIKFYSSDNKAPVDGGDLKYTLDSMGVVYNRSTTWPNFRRLSTNNDSINDLISTAFGYVMMKSSLRCYYCDDKNSHISKEVKVLRAE